MGETKELVEDHLTFVKVGFGYSLEVLVRKGYITDGASIPDNILEDAEYGEKLKSFIRGKFPHVTDALDFQRLVERLIGTPWDMPRLLAAIVHDVLYGRKWAIRLLCDKVYRWILEENGYSGIRADIEYMGIRLVGWRNWNEVYKPEKEFTKIHSEVKFIKTRKIPKEIERLREA